MKLPSFRPDRRPGLRAGVVSACACLVAAAAILVSSTVSDHLAATATQEAVSTTAAVVRAYIDPLVMTGALADLTPVQTETINTELTRLVGSHQILRIKIWAPDGTVLYSDLPALRGQRFTVDDALSDALSGRIATDYSSATAPENVFEAGLATQFLSIYLPIAGPGGSNAGAYEIYEDASPIQAQIATTRHDVLLIVGAMALGLLALLWAAFTVASRVLARQNRQLRRSEERFRSLVQNSADVNMITGSDGAITYESAAVERVLGYRADQRLGASLFSVFHDDDLAWGRQLMADVVLTAGAELGGVVRMRHADGSWRSVEAVLKNLLNDPAVQGIVINYRDITARRALEEELRHQAFHDSLTGLANRALFVDRLEHALARVRRFSRPLAVLFVDLDDFKTVNDSLGHGEGDALLIAVAERLTGALRGGDTIARMGGDEFAVLVEDAVDADAPIEVAERLQAALRAPFRHAGKEFHVRASIGVSGASSDGDGALQLLRNADVSMYAAKAKGKNRIELFEESMHTAALARLALKGDLERALERSEFDLVYQPIVDLETGDMVAAEALLRWRHPTRGVVGPTEFIPVAEETGLIVALGHWVLDEACRQARAWDALLPNRPLRISVNVSGRQLERPDFTAEVRDVLRSTQLDPGRLTLELTESMLMQDTDSAMAMLHELKDLGVRLAIDDFGTGYSSLSYLRRFPIDELKIDRSFVASMSTEPDQLAVVRSILKLGESLRLETVAEGIEELGQLAGLAALGAKLGQGYLFDRPLSGAEMSARIEAGNERVGRAVA